MENLVDIVAIFSIFVALPTILVGAYFGKRFLKLKEKELSIRELELEAEREHYSLLAMKEASSALDKADALRK